MLRTVHAPSFSSSHGCSCDTEKRGFIFFRIVVLIKENTGSKQAYKEGILFIFRCVDVKVSCPETLTLRFSIFLLVHDLHSVDIKDDHAGCVCVVHHENRARFRTIIRFVTVRVLKPPYRSTKCRFWWCLVSGSTCSTFCSRCTCWGRAEPSVGRPRWHYVSLFELVIAVPRRSLRSHQNAALRVFRCRHISLHGNSFLPILHRS